MEVGISNNGKSYTISPVGDIDFSTSEEFEKAVKSIISNANDIIIDMSKVNYISSAGIRVIVYILNEIEGKGIVKIKNANEVVKEVLEITALSSLLEK